MSAPLITIGITCYREGDWLRECWESVLAQTDDRWTAALVMDGTTHARTREVFERLDHPKLRKLALPTNVGPYPARNKAFELTETPYHFYLDGDDQLVPDAVALALETFARYPAAGYVYGDIEYFGDVAEIERHTHHYTAADYINGPHPHGAGAYTKALWEQLGGFAAELAREPADYDFHIGAMEAGVPSQHCGQVFYRRRSGHSSVTGSYHLYMHRVHQTIVRRHPRFFQNRRQRQHFIARGYRRAALAHHLAGDARQAGRLSWGALRLGLRTDRRLWGLMLKNLLPPAVYRVCAALSRHVRPHPATVPHRPAS